MFVRQLDHVNIATPRFSETLEFYKRVLQMNVGPSPIGPHGAFLHDAAGAACIHVASVTAESVDRLLTTNLAHRTREETDPATGFATLYGGGAVDHIAFNCDGLEHTLERFRRDKVPHRYFFIEMGSVHQIFLRDPNGIILELRFFETVSPDILSGIQRGGIESPA